MKVKRKATTNINLLEQLASVPPAPRARLLIPVPPPLWGERGTPMDLPKQMINFDHSYQRPGDAHLTAQKRIVREFNWTAFGRLIVSQRADGSYWCIDGQQRSRAVMQLDGVTHVPCEVFTIASVQEEARLFGLIDRQRTNLRAYEVYVAARTAGEPWARLIHEVMGEAVVRKDAKPGQTIAVQTLIDFAKRNPKGFPIVMHWCMRLSQHTAMPRTLIKVLAYLHAHVSEGLDGVTLQRRLLEVGEMTINEIIRSAPSRSGRSTEAQAEAVLARLNYRKQSLLRLTNTPVRE